MRRGRRGKVNGTPTVNPPQVQAIDDYTGFKVPLGDLKKDWQGLLTTRPDRRNEQDYLRGIKDDSSLPYARPETPSQYVAAPLLWQDGSFMYEEGNSGQLIYSEGVDPASTL